ncbi:hypothetical protein Kpho02_72980 [Kitasatospora phosalacinea]|uniref:Uncharacterized protein n=1 Tax=Kitasatospora phosalacinea TaxID=2065 RepID=A0A9W6V4R7_9ACTN|nr:hypothetical protein [Kitasatospora phosalacinea]GLW75001.1 hypothetical protein Kpho02_72980 [Kitasatospora phosalacinea]
MNAYAAAALENAKARLVIGWPLLLLALALYSPVDGLSRLLLVVVGAVLVVRAVPGHPPVHGKTAPPSAPKSGSPTEKKPAPGAGPRTAAGRRGGIPMQKTARRGGEQR